MIFCDVQLKSFVDPKPVELGESYTGWQLKNGHLEMWLQPKIGALDQNPLTTTIVPYINKNDNI